jgi:hypothetical protein
LFKISLINYLELSFGAISLGIIPSLPNLFYFYFFYLLDFAPLSITFSCSYMDISLNFLIINFAVEGFILSILAAEPIFVDVDFTT